MRDFWRSHQVGIGEFATRFCGSADLYGRARRRPTASVNLITVHDGFTLRDLRQLRRQAQRGQRRGQPRRHRRQPVVELRRRGPDRRSGRADAARAPVRRDAHHLAAVLRRPDAARRGRDRPDPAGQQQCLLPGQRDHLVRLVCARPGFACVHQEIGRLTQIPSGLPPPPVLAWCRGVRAVVVHAGWHSDDRRRLVRSGALWRSLCTSTDPTTRTGPTTARSWWTTTFSCWSTPGGNNFHSPFRPRVPALTWRDGDRQL